ncbi:MAG: TonB-dependent receptor plug domain-containing protein [Spongiibacteraceae bacterium]
MLKISNFLISHNNLLTLAGMVFIANATQAQPIAQQGNSHRSMMEEVVVTARKKAVAESVQDTPIAMTAFNEEQFKAIFAEDLGDLGALSPNVEMKPSSEVGVQNFTIRGMGVNGTTPSDSPAVGVFQNGVFWGTNGVFQGSCHHFIFTQPPLPASAFVLPGST